MKKQTYSEKLKNPKWQKKRLEILQRDNFSCVLCGDTETELHINHLKYTKQPWDAPNKDLQTLCKDCHLLFHKAKSYDITNVIKVKNFNGELSLVFKYKGKYGGDVAFVTYKDGELEPPLNAFCKNSKVLSALYKLNRLK